MGLSRQHLAQLTALIAVAAVAAIVVADRHGSSSRSAAVVLADRGVFSSTHPASMRGAKAEELSARLYANDLALREAIDAWRAGGDPPKSPPPREVKSAARHLQGVVRTLVNHPDLARNTIALLPRPLASDVRDLTGAARDLHTLSSGWPPHDIETGQPRPLSELVRYYDAAYRRYRVDQHYLAAIHLVESKFGRVKSDSVAGAKGPMQFIPSTWEIYGRGGDIQDPHDAILAAANLLEDNGAPGDYGRALHAYNPSRLYVDAVQRYASLIKRDGYAVYYLYCWGP
jgi:soluble lytic murein transglycosylase-like protein